MFTRGWQSLLPVKLSKIEQANERIRSFRLLLPRPVKAR